MPAAPSGRPSRFTAGRVRLTLPPGWHGRVASDGRVLTVQAANFPLPARGISEDPHLAMTPAQVLLTLSALFGSRLPPPSLLQQANKVLTSLRLTVA
jgi:hypothetical protein